MTALTVMQLLPALEAGGVERGTLEITAALVATGHRAVVVSAGGRLVPRLVELGAEHHTLAVGEKSLLTPFRAGRLAGLIETVGADIVHARSRLPAWVAHRALRGLKPRPHFVTTLHGLNSVSRYSSVMTRGDRIIAVSESCRDYWMRNFPQLDPQRVQVIHRGIDPAEFPFGYQPSSDWRRSELTKLGIPDERRLLVLPGRVTRLKGHESLIELLVELGGRGHDCHGLVIGDDAGRNRYRSHLETLAQRLGVVDRLSFTGHRSDVREWLAVADVVMSLSETPESFGRTVAEALALGRPVVGWGHGGVGEILNEVYPIGAVQKGDLAALTDRVGALLQTPEPVPDRQPFQLKRMQSETIALYESLGAIR